MSHLTPRLIPSLLVSDMAETLAFYETLGFHLSGCETAHAEARWAEVSRDAITLQFYCDPPNGTPQHPVCSGTLYLHPTSVDELADELAARGVVFAWGPEEMEYGMREFAVRDPNGYLLAFTEPGAGGTHERSS